ncbi:MAG: hypothetical protein DMD35_16290 [Gemmatimonadetes bacterium]|nr:MAG: hypothetical protein DMD35_16290 [Gemmatimonadota bacterium]
MPGQHLPADHRRGDANTIGGYAAVHGRPAAFEGPDGLSYSVEIVTAPTGHPEAAFGAYLLFVQWSRIGATTPSGHVETDFLAEADTAEDAQVIVAALSLSEVRAALHAAVAERSHGAPTRRWWDAMRDEGNDADSGGAAG